MEAHVLLIGPFEFFLQVAPLLARAELETEVAEPGPWALQRLASEDFDAVLIQYPLPGLAISGVVQHLCDDAAVRLRGLLILVAEPGLLPQVERRFQDGSSRVVILPFADRSRVSQVICSILQARPRVATRLEVELEVALGKGQAEIPCVTRNISATGLLVETNAPLGLGARADARIYLPSPYASIPCRIEVMRHTASSRSGLRGMGIRFLEFAEDGRRIWDRWLGERLSDPSSRTEDEDPRVGQEPFVDPPTR